LKSVVPPGARQVGGHAVVTRQTVPTVQVLSNSAWWKRLLADVRGATEVLVGSYLFDNSALVAGLLKRLEGRVPFALTVLVDKAGLTDETCRFQRPRLAALRAAGAEVRLCTGKPPYGIFHVKALVVDRKLAFTGNGNLTNKMTQNVELLMVLGGPPVADVLRLLERERESGRLWDGS